MLQPEDSAATHAAVAQHLHGLSAFYSQEFRLRAKNGSWRWILGRGRFVERDAEGRPLVMTGTNLAVTERKRAEEAMAAAAMRLRSILDTVVDGIIHRRAGCCRGGKFCGRAPVRLSGGGDPRAKHHDADVRALPLGA